MSNIFIKRHTSGVRSGIPIPTVFGEMRIEKADLDDPLSWPATNRRWGFWKSCPECSLNGYRTLLSARTLRLHLQDSYLAKRLQLPHPIPEKAVRVTKLKVPKAR